MHKHSEEKPNSAVFHLLLDHKVMREVIDSLERKLIEYEKRNEISISFMISFLNFSFKFLDTCHKNKEEKCFFPALERAGMHKAPIEVMIQEHSEIKTLLHLIEEKLKEYSEKKIEANQLISLCYDLIALIRSHFFKEENVLFRAGTEILNEEDQNKSVVCYEEIEKDVKHEEILKMAENLKK